MISEEGTGKLEQEVLGLDNLNTFSGLWSTGAVPGCLVPVLGLIRTGV